MTKFKIVDEAEAEQAGVVVCCSVGDPSDFEDNVETVCAHCGKPIFHRPYVPQRPQKLCIPCAMDLFPRRRSVTIVAGIIAAAQDPGVDDLVVDGLVTRYLLACQLLTPAPDGLHPDDDLPIAVPGFCRTKGAVRLMTQLLPGWEPDFESAGAIVRPHRAAPSHGCARGAGPTPARQLIAATFAALLVVGEAAPLPFPCFAAGAAEAA